MNDEVIETYESNNLIIRAMEAPGVVRDIDGFVYDCSVWANEFALMQNNSFSSVSSTLLIPGVGVSTYKNVGYLVDARLAECFHISKSDSLSSGNISQGDFNAGEQDFETIEELGAYIKENNARTMNEVNMNLNLSGVIGLVVNKCAREKELLKRMLYVIRCLEVTTGITYPVYEYDSTNGIISRIELTTELIDELTSMTHKIPQYNTDKLRFYTDYSSEVFYEDIKELNVHKHL